MTKEYIKTRKRFTPEVGAKYTNTSGAEFTCVKAGCREGEARMRSSGGWLFLAHGCGMYEDGRIDWDYSTDGHF